MAKQYSKASIRYLVGVFIFLALFLAASAVFLFWQYEAQGFLFPEYEPQKPDNAIWLLGEITQASDDELATRQFYLQVLDALGVYTPPKRYSNF